MKYVAILFSGAVAGTEPLSAEGDTIEAAKEALSSLPRFSDVVAALVEDGDVRYEVFLGDERRDAGYVVDGQLVPRRDEVDG